MHANDHPTSGLYLRGLLAAGARPFPPRSGVYRLLGRPAPQGSAVRFPPPLPPVGFVYADLARLGATLGPGGAPRPAPPPGREAGEAPEGGEEGAPLRPRLTPSASEETRARGAERAAPSPIPAPPTPSLSVPHAPVRSGGRRGEEAEPSTPASTAARVDEPAASLRSTGAPADPGLLGEAPHGAPTRGGVEFDRVEPADVSLVGRPPAVSAERDAASRPDEKRVGLAIPGLTQRRSAFAALSGAYSPPQDVSASSQPRPSSPASDAEADGPSTPARVGAEEGRSLPASPLPSLRPDESAAFRARTRIVEEVEHVRRAVAAQGPQVTSETVRAVAREVVREAVREGGANARAEGSPARRVEPVPAPVVVVQQSAIVAERVPRAFWSSSALRSRHLRMLR